MLCNRIKQNWTTSVIRLGRIKRFLKSMVVNPGVFLILATFTAALHELPSQIRLRGDSEHPMHTYIHTVQANLLTTTAQGTS